jgi:hypothetical protein
MRMSNFFSCLIHRSFSASLCQGYKSKRFKFPLLLLLLLAHDIYAQEMVYISGKLPVANGSKVKVNYIKTCVEPNDIALADSTVINNKGTFSMRFAWSKPLAAQLIIGTKTYPVFLSPGDSLTVSAADKTISIQGNDEDVNNYLIKANLKYDVRKIMRAKQGKYRSMEPKRFLNYVDSIHNDRISFYKNYFKTPPSKAFSDYQQAEINYEWANDHYYYLGVRFKAESIIGSSTVDSSFYSFLKKVEINKETAISSPFYFKFLQSYIISLIPEYFLHPILKNNLKEDHTIKKYTLAKEKLTGHPRNILLAQIISRTIDGPSSKDAENILADYKQNSSGPIDDSSQYKDIEQMLKDYKQYNSEYYNWLNAKYQDKLKKRNNK